MRKIMVVYSFKSVFRLCALLLLMVVGLHEAMAQGFHDQFGKNRLQYKEFNWKFYYSNNFEVYFYKDGEGVAKDAIEYLEQEFNRVTETIGHPPYSKTRVFLYNSITDKQQSNVGLKGQDFAVGGQTSFVKSQIEVAYTGNLQVFKEDLIYRVTNMMIEEMLFGGSVAEMFQSSFSTPLPVWFTSGAAAYISSGWSKESDDFAREYVSNNLTNKFNKLDKQHATLLGQSIWNFVARQYGKRDISNILNLARIVRNEESSIERTLGLPYNRFIADWRAFYSEINLNLMSAYESSSPDDQISGKSGRYESITDVRISPDGKLIAYASMNLGQYEVKVVDISSGKEKVVLKGGSKLKDQEVDLRYPLLSWADDNTIGIVNVAKGRNMLTIKRIGAKGTQEIEIPRFSQINSFDFKSNGRLAVVSGTIKASSDIFLYNINRGTIRRLTNDSFDDVDARFIPNSNLIVFSSNRQNDSLLISGPDNLEDVVSNRYNLFTYDIDNTDSLLGKLTNNLASEVKPVPVSPELTYYLSDQQGINNMYKHQIRDTVSSQMSNYIYGLKTFDVNVSSGIVAYITTELSKDALFYEEFDANKTVFTPITPRRAHEVTLLLAERRRQRLLESDTVETAIELPSETLINEIKKDSLVEGTIDTENYSFKNQTKVDTKNYQFEKPKENTSNPSRSFLSIYQNINTENSIKGPVNYETRFMTNELVVTTVIDELRSFSQLLEIRMNDFLENHRFYGGILLPLNFNSGYDIYAEYQFLKYQVDLSTKYFRKSLRRTDGLFRQKYNLNKFDFGGSFPFNPNLRLELTPFFAQTRYDDLDPRLLIINPPPAEPATIKANYAGLGLNLVFDNSLVMGTNLHDGTRAKLKFENYSKLNTNAQSFSRLEVDVRHYERVTKGVTFAFKGYFGAFLGDAPKKYLLGGVDNWAFNQTEGCTSSDCPLFLQTLFDNSDILFHEFTNLRGYNYNTFSGSKVLTFSAELRLPIFEFFDRIEQRSSFIRNLQLLAFYDIGSAWDDLSPFRDTNNLNTEVVNPGGPFDAVINNFNNPWLQSTGFGVRSKIFGFFAKLEVAWPMRNFKIENPKFMASIGYDF